MNIEDRDRRRDSMLLLKNSEWEYFRMEFGAAAVNCKRPYGNSDPVPDIARILNIEPALVTSDEGDVFSDEQKYYMHSCHEETVQTIQQLLLCDVDDLLDLMDSTRDEEE